MSLARVCDCKCHDYDEVLHKIEEFEQWDTFGGKDVCQWCLDGCPHWSPHVVPEPTGLQQMVRMVYERAILDALSNEPLFRGIVASDGE